MDINLSTIIFTIINFFILVGLLTLFLYKPVEKLLSERQAKIDESLSSAARDRDESAMLRKEYEEKLVKLKQDAHDAMERAVWQGEKTKNELISAARKEAELIIQRAEVEISKERERVWEELRDNIADIALLSASKVVERSIDQSDFNRIFDEVVSELEAQKQGEAV